MSQARAKNPTLHILSDPQKKKLSLDIPLDNAPPLFTKLMSSLI